MENFKIKPKEFSDELYLLVYGDKTNIAELRKQKSIGEVFKDIVDYLAKNDISKIEEIKKIPAEKAFDFLNRQVNTIRINNIPKELPKIESVGYKRNI